MGNKRDFYVHLVWATKNREPTIPPDQEEIVYRILVSEAGNLGCQTLAVGGIANHVHVLIQLSVTVPLAKVVNQLKGVSSSYLNDSARQRPDDKRFRWQEGYGVFSVGRNQVETVRQYVQRQKEHHSKQNLWAAWEETPKDSYQTTQLAGPEARPS